MSIKTFSNDPVVPARLRLAPSFQRKPWQGESRSAINPLLTICVAVNGETAPSVRPDTESGASR